MREQLQFQPDLSLQRPASLPALLAILFAFITAGPVLAQPQTVRTQDARIERSTGTARAIYRPSFDRGIRGRPDEVARAFLQSDSRIGWNGSSDRLRLASSRESVGGTHVTFQQYVGDVPVLGAVTKVSLNRDSEPTFVLNGFRPEIGDDVVRDPFIGRAVAENLAAEAVEGGDALVDEASLVILPGDPARLVWKTIVWPETGGEWMALIDARSGEVAQLVNMTLHRSPKARVKKEGRMVGYMDFSASKSSGSTGIQTTGQGMVFDPDPLATSGMPYGAPYADADDAEVPELNAERVTVELLNLSLFADNRYRLAGPYVEVVGRRPFGVANYDPPSELDPNAFAYTRGDERFEGVMAYYHMDSSQRRVQQLGFTNIQNTPVPVNPFGEGDADNSNYYLALNFVALGGGGIDDAEDAFVIWHEYAHALLNANVPDFISTTEGRSIHEGWSDYWAASYQRTLFESGALPPGDWKRLFRWDGNYSGWFGRQMPDFRHYPDDLTGSNIYSDGLVLASAFMGVWDRLGPDVTDRLVLQGQYYLTNSSNMQDYAEAVIQADIDLYGAEHAKDIIEVFAERGLVDPGAYGPVIAHEPLGDTEQVGGSVEVSAQILGIISAIRASTLTYTVNGTTQTVNMANLGSGNYTSPIPLPATPAVVEYYIVATDVDDQEVRFPPDAPEEVVRFQAGPDQDAPLIHHTPIAQTSVLGWPPVVNATIVDNIGVDSAYVDYVIEDLDLGSQLDAGRFSLVPSGDLYSGSFPELEGEVDGNEKVTYRITANDYSAAANKASLPPSSDPAFEFIVTEQGTVATFDFESGSSDVTTTGVWEHGTPSFGVNYAHSGSNVWATSLERSYPDFPGTAELVLPALNLAGLQTAWLEFWHWYDIEHDGQAEPASDVNATLWDGGVVQVSTDGGSSWATVTPEGGYDGTIPAGSGNPLENEPAFGGFSYGWRQEAVQIPAGPSVMIRFIFGHDISNEEESINYAGWIIDDVSIRVDQPRDLEPPVVIQEPDLVTEGEAGSPVGPMVSLRASDDIGIESVLGSYDLSGPSRGKGTFRLAQSPIDPQLFEGRIPVGSTVTVPQSVIIYTLEVADFGGNKVVIPSEGQPYRVEYVFVARENQLSSVTPSGGWSVAESEWSLAGESFSGGVAALVLNPIDLPSDAADIRFEMEHDYRIGDAVVANVQVSTDDGLVWTPMVPTDGDPDTGGGFSGQANGEYSVFDMNEYSGKQVYLRIQADAAEGFGEEDFWRIRSASTVFKAEGDRFTIPRLLELRPNFPNPFTHSTTISYTLPAASDVNLAVYDVLGRRISTILEKQQEAGSYSLRWDAGNIAGGTYFVRLTTSSGQVVQPMSIIP